MQPLLSPFDCSNAAHQHDSRRLEYTAYNIYRHDNRPDHHTAIRSWYVGTSATPLCIMGLMCICNCADRWRCFPTLFRLNRTSNEQIVELTIYQGEKMRCVVLWVVRSVEDQVVDCYFECNQEQNKAMVVRFGPRA